MDILMLRFDIFEDLHAGLYVFWKGIITCYYDENVSGFAFTFVENEHIGQKMSPYIYTLGVDSMYADEPLTDIEVAQSEIAEKLKMPKVLVSARARLYHINEDVDKMSAEVKELLQEYYELEESKKIALREIEKLESVIKKEMRKFWNRIDTLIIDSYKQMLYDVTGSDDLVKSFMSELRVLRIMESLFWARRHNEYESISNMITMLDDSICNWISELEQLVLRNTT